jgi:hypothetical protein
MATMVSVVLVFWHKKWAVQEVTLAYGGSAYKYIITKYHELTIILSVSKQNFVTVECLRTIPDEVINFFLR